jgi:multidrug efflux system membrane fusion protein
MDDRPQRLAPEQYQSLHGQTRRGWFSLRSIAIAIVLIALAVLVAWYLTPAQTTGPSGRGGRFNPNQPMPVVAGTVRTGDMPVTLNGLGTVTPLATVTVKTQISGYLQQIAFSEGQMVKEGDFLAQIDPRPYQVALEQAEGTLAHDQALLVDARLDLTRYETLLKQDSIAEQQRDTQAALVRQYEGTVKADQGQVDAAKLNLAYCHIVAPVQGRVGLRQVDQGNYVTPGDTNGIVVITQMQPITVVYTLPEDSIPATLKRFRAGATLQAAAWDRAHVEKLADGALASIDNQIDTTTGTVKLKANFANADEALFPNQFVNVEMLLDTLHAATIVPQSAVQRGAPGTYVYLIDKAASTVSVRPITLGPGNATDVVVTKGLAAGDLVVVDGADKLKDGGKITMPNANAAPGGTAPAQVTGDGQAGNPQGGNGQSANGQGWQHNGQGNGQGGQHHHRNPGVSKGDQQEQQDQDAAPPGQLPQHHYPQPFILRPVATSLLMAAILLVGIVAFGSCRSRRCRRSITRPSRCRPSIPAPARR